VLLLRGLFVKYHRIDIFHCCLEINNGCTFDPSNLEFDPLPQEKDTEVAIRGMQRPRDFQLSQNDFLLSSFRMALEQ
jgi:hypothetical protein